MFKLKQFAASAVLTICYLECQSGLYQLYYAVCAFIGLGLRPSLLDSGTAYYFFLMVRFHLLSWKMSILLQQKKRVTSSVLVRIRMGVWQSV